MNKLVVRVTRQVAQPGAIDALIERLDKQPGLYCAGEAGVPGLHPAFGWALTDPALILRVTSHRVELTPATGTGRALLAHPALAPLVRRSDATWVACIESEATKDPLRGPVARWLGRLLAAFDAPAPFGLFGLFGFEHYRLHAQVASPIEQDLGVLFLPSQLWSADATGGYEHLRFTFDLPVEAAQVDACIDPASGEPGPASRHSTSPALMCQDDLAPGDYARAVARGLTGLQDGTLVSLTLSQSFRRAFCGSPAQAFQRLRSVNPAPVVFAANPGNGQHLFGASPDLQGFVREGIVESFPVCGTVKRGPGPLAQAQAFRELVNETVDEASLAICSDALRNDLTPLCEPGSVQLTARRAPLALATVVHMVDALRGTLCEGVGVLDVLVATAAPVMVTGTPRAAALAAIAALETTPRHWYGGAVARLGCDGSGEIGTILRTAWLHDGIAEVRCGGDLVADSEPAREEAESRTKAVSLWRALGAESASAASSAPQAATLSEVIIGPASVPTLALLTLAIVDCGDPFPATSCAMLASMASIRSDGAMITVLTGGTHHLLSRARAEARPSPVLALGEAGLWLLATESARWRRSGQHLQGRSTLMKVDAQAPLTQTPDCWVGWYGEGLMPTESPDGARDDWACWARDPSGNWLVAASACANAVAVCFRADSVLSEAPAQAVVRAALQWLQPRCSNTEAPGPRGGTGS